MRRPDATVVARVPLRALLLLLVAPVAGLHTAATAAPPALDATPLVAPAAFAFAAPGAPFELDGHRPVWSDEFAGPAGPLPADSAWDPQTGAGWGDGQRQAYTDRPANVALDGLGRLAITVRRERYVDQHGTAVDWTSARLQTKGRFSFTYGRVEARIRVPAGAGIWPAFWTVGDDIYERGWPESGEIDVMEVLGGEPDVLYGTVHNPVGAPVLGWDGPQWEAQGEVRHATPLSDDFHVYGAVWTPEDVTFTFDGRSYATAGRAEAPTGGRWVLDKPQHLLLNVAVGGPWSGPPDASTPSVGTMLVDWVRVWR